MKIKIKYTSLFVLLILVLIPRFNCQDLGIKKFTGNSLGDAPQYIRFVESLRGNENVGYPDQPFSYRPLIPLLSAPLPFDAMTSLNIINTIILLLSLLFYILLLKNLAIPDKAIIISALLLVFSFPMFYYGSIGRIDSIGLLAIISGTYFMYKEKIWTVLLIIFIGSFGKEIAIALVPIIFMYYLFEKRDIKRAFVWASIGGLIFVLASFLCHKFFGIGEHDYSPAAGMETFMFNVVRPRTWISTILSFGIPGILSFIIFAKYLRNKKTEEVKSLLLPFFSILMFLGLFAISIISAYSDGRFIWPASFFSCWIVAYHLKTIFERVK